MLRLILLLLTFLAGVDTAFAGCSAFGRTPTMTTPTLNAIYDPTRTTEGVVVSLNGVVAGVSPLSAGDHPGQYAALLPPALLRTGRNTVDLYGIGSDGRLSPIGLAGRS